MDAIKDYPVLLNGNEHSSFLSKKYGYKEWMISRFLIFIPFPEQMLEYIHNSKNLHYYIRVNTLRTNPQELKRRLYEKGYHLTETILKEVFEIKNHGFGDIEIKDTEIKVNHQNKDRNNNLNVNIATQKDCDLQPSKGNGPISQQPSIGSTIEYLKG